MSSRQGNWTTSSGDVEEEEAQAVLPVLLLDMARLVTADRDRCEVARDGEAANAETPMARRESALLPGKVVVVVRWRVVVARAARRRLSMATRTRTRTNELLCICAS